MLTVMRTVYECPCRKRWRGGKWRCPCGDDCPRKKQHTRFIGRLKRDPGNGAVVDRDAHASNGTRRILFHHAPYGKRSLGLQLEVTPAGRMSNRSDLPERFGLSVSPRQLAFNCATGQNSKRRSLSLFCIVQQYHFANKCQLNVFCCGHSDLFHSSFARNKCDVGFASEEQISDHQLVPISLQRLPSLRQKIRMICF